MDVYNGPCPDWCKDRRLWNKTHGALVAEVLDARTDLANAFAELDELREQLKDVDRGIRTLAEVVG